MAKSKIAIGYVHPDQVSAFFMTSLIRLLRLEGHRIEEVITVHSGPKIDDARNQVMTEWLTRTKASRLLMVDTDMILPPDTISRLISHNKDIVGGLCFAGGWSGAVRPTLHVIEPGPDDTPTIGIMWDYPVDSLVEVDATGAACMMITRRCAEDIWAARGEDHPMPWFAHGLHNGVRIGEDIAFCLTAKKVGFKIYVDTSLEIPHVKSFAMGSKDYLRSLIHDSHPHYTERENVPLYQEIMNDQPSLQPSG